MSEPKQISPLLDGFSIGEPMSDHDGVRCCPALKDDSQEKYIVKIVTIPSTQSQMDALLLAGAYKDASGAMDYFKTVVEDVFQEAELLRTLSKLDGFVGYEGWQMEPITRRRLGYEVYLLSQYRQSLFGYVQKNPITHLEAINLGLDMCSALWVARQAGSMYVDLKPTNIYVSDKKEYRIGDLGFVSMDALSYTTLPDKYRSGYTPPELLDPMANISLTADTYALGMILYQLYNDGQLPIREDDSPLAAPVHADYELAEIILKAIALDPQDRWQDPREMGQALIGYMQRNVVNDVPITPYTPLEPEAEPEPSPDEAAETQEGEPSDETEPGEADAQELMPHEMSDEMSKMIAKADDLIAHETPEGVVVPEIPEPPDPFAFAKEGLEPEEEELPPEPESEDPQPETESAPVKPAKHFASQEGKKKAKKYLGAAGLLLLAAAILAGFVWSYQNLYLQPIEGLSITGSRSQLTVNVDSSIAEGLLTASCTDQFGKAQTAPIEQGKATFTGLQPNTMYTISLEISGFHRLVGQTSEVFTTDTTTRIVSFSSVAGKEDGTVILNFTVDGDEPKQWILTYSAPGEPEKHQGFTGHSITVENLELGKTYSFRLSAEEDLSLGGQTTLEVMASRLILAQDFTFSSTGSDLTLRWKAPGDIMVASWQVRCTGDNGYEQQLTVQEPEAHFVGIDPAASYTIEVTASGMTQSAIATISANPVIVTDFSVSEADPTALKLDWDYQGDSPEGGWMVLYSVNGVQMPDVVKSEHSEAVISPLVPSADYSFSILSADGSTVLSGDRTYTTGASQNYQGNQLRYEDITAKLVETPEKKDWHTETLGADAFRQDFTVGDDISLTLQTGATFYRPGTNVSVLFLIRDSSGTVLPECTVQQVRPWRDLWEGGSSSNAELNIPRLPSYSGQFTVNVLVDGMLLAQADFTLSR